VASPVSPRKRVAKVRTRTKKTGSAALRKFC
jgi:hypothetical protein